MTNKTPQWEKEFEDMFPFELETNIAIREDIKGGYHERIDVRDDVKAFIKSTLEKVIERIEKQNGYPRFPNNNVSYKGEYINQVIQQLRKEFL